MTEEARQARLDARIGLALFALATLALWATERQVGFVRDERDYSGLDALVDDIRIDCDVARQSLARPAWTPAEGRVVGDGNGPERGTLDGSWLVR